MLSRRMCSFFIVAMSSARRRRGGLCTVFGFVPASFPALLGPGEVKNRDDEEAVRGVGNTGESVVPGQEGCKNTEGTSGAGETNGRRAVLEDKEGAAEE